MIWNAERKCVTNDDGSLIRPVRNGCPGHSSGIGNKYKCSSLACGCDQNGIGLKPRHIRAILTDLKAVKGGMDGLYLAGDHYRSEHLDDASA